MGKLRKFHTAQFRQLYCQRKKMYETELNSQGRLHLRLLQERRENSIPMRENVGEFLRAGELVGENHMEGRVVR